MSVKAIGLFFIFFQATHWSHGVDAERVREASSPPLTQKFWTDKFNRMLMKEYNLNAPLQSIFLDTFYNVASNKETNIFNNNSESLLNFSKTRKPFQCKFC